MAVFFISKTGGVLFGGKNQPGDPELYGIHVLQYSELLNSFDSGATTKITISNRRLNRQDFEKAILIPMQEDGLDLYRKEYNSMLLERVAEANSMVQEKYVTVSVYKKSIEEARTYFARVGPDLAGHFMRLGSKCVEMDATDKLRARP